LCPDLATPVTESSTLQDRMSLQVFGCPDCAQPFQVDSSQAGQQVRCPSCSGVVQIPAALGDAQTDSADQPPTPAAPEPQEVPEAFACPACQSAFGALSSMYGSSMACPHCGQAVLIERAPASPAPTIDVNQTPSTDVDPKLVQTAGGQQKKKTSSRKKRPTQSETIPAPPVEPDQQSAFPNLDTGLQPTGATTPTEANASSVATSPPSNEEFSLVGSASESDQSPSEPAPVAVFEAQNVDHLLPPRFATLDPEFFYRRGSPKDQVLLPQADGSVQAVSNRIVTIVHHGREYELISSERYRVYRGVADAGDLAGRWLAPAGATDDFRFN